MRNWVQDGARTGRYLGAPHPCPEDIVLTRSRPICGRWAFTLIELVVVIIILGLLTAIAGATYVNAVDTSKEKAVIDQALKVDAELRRAALRPVTTRDPAGGEFDPYANARRGPDANPRIAANVKRLRSDVQGSESVAEPVPGAPDIPPSGEIEASVAFPVVAAGEDPELEFQRTGHLSVTLNGKTACLTVSQTAGEPGLVAEKVLDAESETCEGDPLAGVPSNWP